MGVIEARRRILLSAPHPVTTTPDPVATFDTDMVGKLRSAKFAFLPVQSGSGDPSPTNVRPISGWDGVTAEQAGKNLFDKTNYNYINAYIPTTGTGVLTDSSSRVTVYMPCKPNTTYTVQKIAQLTDDRFYLSYTKELPAVGIATYGGVKAPDSQTVGNKSSITITTGNDAKYLVCWLSWNADALANEINTFQIELGSTATPYAPYTGSIYPVSWQSEAGTIYGGYVDVVRGEVVETIHGYTFTGSETISNFSTTLNAAMYHQNNLDGAVWASKSGGVAQACNYAVATGRSTIANYSNAIVVGDTTGGNEGILFLKIDGVTSADAMKAWLKEKYDGGNPLIAVYKLATPIHYALTPQIIKSLRGANNLWSNANGDAQVTYWTH